MDTQNQNQTQPATDYNFILNPDNGQPGVTPPAHKNNKQRLILVIGVIFVVFLLVVAIIAASVSSNVKSGDATQDSTNAITQYLDSLGAKDYAKAYSLLATNYRPATVEVFTKEPPAVGSFMQPETCTIGSSVATEQTESVDVECNHKTNNSTVDLTFDIIKESGQSKIARVTIGSQND